MTRFFVRHPVTTWMIFTAFVVLAIYALPKIQIEAMPEVDLPTLTIATSWNGASPKAIQRSITLPIEEAVRAVHGVETVTSTSRAGQSVVEVEFRREIDIDFARLELNEQLGTVRRNLPLNASQPQITTFVPEEFETEQFFTVSIESPLPPNELRDRAETWILPQVVAVPGVADAQVTGGARSLVKVLLDRERLDFYGISADEVFTSVDALDALAGAGVIHQDGLEKLVSIRSPVELEELENAVVARRGGRSFQLKMLGEVRATYEDPVNFVRANGQNVVQLQVEKRSGSNSVVVSRTLRDALPRIQAGLPFEATFHVDRDEGEDLEEKLRELIGRSGVILLVLFLLLAISLRQVQLTSIVILSIVFAIVICLSFFYFLKLSVNFVTISGLTICFGMLLDNSILVLDSIHRRLEALDRAEEAQLSRRSKLQVAMETVVQGTGEVIFPILATTLTTMVAFLSFIFLSGRLAVYYVPLAISVATAMFASIFVAFGWIPVVLNQTWAARLARRGVDGPNDVEDPSRLQRIVEELPDLTAPLRWPQRWVSGSQRVWWLIVPLVGALMVWGGFLYKDKVLKGGFFQLPDNERLILYMRLPEGTDVKVSSEQLLKFEELLVPVHEGARMRAQAFSNVAYMEVEFEEELLRTGIPMLYRSLLTDLADRTGGTAIYINGFADQPYVKGTFRGAAMNSLIKITGYNSRRLEEIAQATLAKVERQRRVRNPRITSSSLFGRVTEEETVVSLRRDVLADNGLSVLQVVGHLRRLLGVDTPWSMLIDGDQERMQLAFTDADDIEFSQVEQHVIRTSRGEQVRLGDLMELETVPLSDAVRREDQRYTMFVNWEYVGTDRMRQAYLKSILESIDLPYGYAAEEARREFFTEEEEADLKLTVGLAIAFIFLVLAALFESLSLPFMVLLAIPLALIGVFVLFWLTGTAFDSSARIGLVLLFGIVVNNAILLVSRFRHEASLVLKTRLGGDPEAEAALFRGQRKRLGGSDLYLLPGEERATLLRRAVARGTLIRLRSILLTSGTTIVGLVPLLVSIQKVPWKIGWLFNVTLPFTVQWMDTENQDIWENLALASIGGLISSTILILLAIPPLYYGCVRVGWVARRAWGAMRGRMRRLPERESVPSTGPALDTQGP